MQVSLQILGFFFNNQLISRTSLRVVEKSSQGKRTTATFINGKRNQVKMLNDFFYVKERKNLGCYDCFSIWLS